MQATMQIKLDGAIGAKVQRDYPIGNRTRDLRKATNDMNDGAAELKRSSLRLISLFHQPLREHLDRRLPVESFGSRITEVDPA